MARFFKYLQKAVDLNRDLGTQAELSDQPAERGPPMTGNVEDPSSGGGQRRQRVTAPKAL